MKIERIEAKTLIRTSKRSPYNLHMNLYQGCYHNCAYCDGTSDNYHMHKDFSTRIKAKVNAPDLFEDFLKKKKLKPIFRKNRATLGDFGGFSFSSEMKHKLPRYVVSLFGNVCDIYQPAEKECQITRKILQIALDYGLAIRILTKSNLVLRDMDLIKKIHEKSFARVAFTVTLHNEDDQKNFEPFASSTSERIEAIAKFRQAGIPSGAYITPVIPFIGDTPENLDNLFKQLKRVDSEFVITGGLTLKKRNKLNFMKVIKEKYPQLTSKIESLYSNYNQLYDYGQPNPEIALNHNLPNPVYEGYFLAKKNKINFFEPRYIPDIRFRKNLVVATYLARIGFLKKTIYPEDGHCIYEGAQFQKAAREIEYLQKDLTTMSHLDIKKLKYHDKTVRFEKSIIDSINELLSAGTSHYLKEKDDFGDILYCK